MVSLTAGLRRILMLATDVGPYGTLTQASPSASVAMHTARMLRRFKWLNLDILQVYNRTYGCLRRSRPSHRRIDCSLRRSRNPQYLGASMGYLAAVVALALLA